MSIANVDNRAILVIGHAGDEKDIDIATGSHGRFASELPAIHRMRDE